MIQPRIICVDFDGTCVTHEYPKVGRYIGAEPVLLDLVENGHRLILYTMRSRKGFDPDKSPLDDAIRWFQERNIPLFGVNQNPEQHTWSYSPKPYAHLYIDDAALGCPLLPGLNGERPYANWEAIRIALQLKGYLPL